MLAREKYTGRTHAGSGRRACQAPLSADKPFTAPVALAYIIGNSNNTLFILICIVLKSLIRITGAVKKYIYTLF